MAFRARLFAFAALFSIYALLTGTTHALAPEADDSGCQNEGPLLAVSWEGTLPESGFIGAWPVPLSPKHPDILTEARIILEWDAKNGARATFSFPDPLPYGIPFSFQKMELSWDDGALAGSRTIDWSEDCSSPGRSLFPGQSWSALFESAVPKTVRKVRLRLWGARN